MNAVHNQLDLGTEGVNTDSDDSSSVLFLELSKAATVNNASDYIAHIKRLAKIGADDTVQLVSGI